MRARTKGFALAAIRLTESLPKRRTADVIGRQLLRSATSVGANYRSACRARSKADFAAKMAKVLEEADETLYWLELLDESGLARQDDVAPLSKKAAELVAICVTSIKTVKASKAAS